jgi:hypothetical protein
MTRNQPKLLDVIVCDEVRQESNGKLLILGMYLDNMGVPVVPFTLPVLTFLCKWRFDRGRLPAGRFRVLAPSGAVVRESALPPVEGPTEARGLVLTTIRFQGLTVTELGRYRLVFTPAGGRSRIVAELQVDRTSEPVPGAAPADEAGR